MASGVSNDSHGSSSQLPEPYMNTRFIENLNLMSDMSGRRVSRGLPLNVEAYLSPYRSRMDEIMLANVSLVMSAKEKDIEKMYRSRVMVSVYNKAACSGFAAMIMGPRLL